MKRVNASYAFYFNQKYHRVGTCFRTGSMETDPNHYLDITDEAAWTMEEGKLFLVEYLNRVWLGNSLEDSMMNPEPRSEIIGHIRGKTNLSVRKIADLLGIWGIPIGLIACSYLIYFSNNVPGIIYNIIIYIVHLESGHVVAAQIILGYVLITSFYKRTID